MVSGDLALKKDKFAWSSLYVCGEKLSWLVFTASNKFAIRLTMDLGVKAFVWSRNIGSGV